MSGAVEIVLILAAVGYLVVRRVLGESAQAKRTLMLPAVLSLVGLSDVSGQAQTSLSLLFLVAAAAISVILGVLRGASVRISLCDGLAFVRYTAVTVALWVVNLAVKFGANLTLGVIDPKQAGALSNGLLLTLGLGILAEGLVVLYRALRNDHPVMWSQGRRGAPRRKFPVLDNPRHNLTNRDDSPYQDDRATGWNTRAEPLREHRR